MKELKWKKLEKKGGRDSEINSENKRWCLGYGYTVHMHVSVNDY